MQPNKVEGVGAALGPEYRKKLAAEQYAKMKGDKGSRGTDIDPSLAKYEAERMAAKKKRPPVIADRNRTPESLGLKQWDGS